MSGAALPMIVALARAGATERAWELLRAFEEDGAADDPAVLTVRARLLKDQAMGAAEAERRRLYRDSAAAYRRASELRPGTYPLINAASLSLLGGDAVEAGRLARQVLERIDAEPDEPETPYWRGATRAEALLLLGRHDEARSALAEAVALAPRAWEDHAATLRQFRLILETQGQGAGWLDAHRPPRSLHFGGHMSFDARVSRRAHLDEAIAAAMAEERVGFGFGALAAGADILVAEALLERGAELHAVLPGGPEAFAAVSVDPFGKGWRKRFDALLDLAATVRTVRPVGTAPSREMIALADEIAMGAAAMNARRLESEALQLLVVDAEHRGAAGTAAKRWAKAGWRQRFVPAPREASAPAADLPAAGHRRLALLTVPVEAEQALDAVAAVLASAAPAIAAYHTGAEAVAAYPDVAEAAEIARSLADAAGVGVGGHFGIAEPLRDPFSGGLRIGGDPAALAAAAAASAPPGAICVTADFAAALAAARGKGIRMEPVGELEERGGGAPVELFALKPSL